MRSDTFRGSQKVLRDPNDLRSKLAGRHGGSERQFVVDHRKGGATDKRDDRGFDVR